MQDPNGRSTGRWHRWWHSDVGYSFRTSPTAMVAALIAFIYSVVILRLREPHPIAPLPQATFDFVVFDSVVIGVAVGISLTLAQVLQLERPYWVPVSCLAVIQGLSLRAVWTRQLHRVLGTALGLLLAWMLLALPLEKWSISLLVIALSFIIESAVVRHYGFAVIFITPLTIFLADAATLGHEAPNAVIEARLLDTLLDPLLGRWQDQLAAAQLPKTQIRVKPLPRLQQILAFPRPQHVDYARFLGGGEKLLENGKILSVREELEHGVAVPVEPEPAHPVEDRGDRRLGRARAIGILDAQKEGAACVTGIKPVEQSGARTADVQKSGGRGRKTGDNRTGHRQRQPFLFQVEYDGFCTSRCVVAGRSAV